MRGGWDEYDHQTFLKFRSRYKVGQRYCKVMALKTSIYLLFLVAANVTSCVIVLPIRLY